MIPWYRQLLALVFGVGVMIISVWAIDQGNGGILISSVAGMSFLTLLLIFGVEVDTIKIGDKVRINFTDTALPGSTRNDDSDDDAERSDDQQPLKLN